MSGIRKIQKRSGMMIISLPQWWLKARHIKAGDYLEVSTHADHIKLIPPRHKAKPKTYNNLCKNIKRKCKTP